MRVLFIAQAGPDTNRRFETLQKTYDPVSLARVESDGELRQSLENGEWNAIVWISPCPQLSVEAALAAYKDSESEIPFFILCEEIGEETAVCWIHMGASDVILKHNFAGWLAAIEREKKESANRKKMREVQIRFQLFERLEAVGRLAGGIAHDFNNLLTAINGHADILLENLKGHPEWEESAAEIKKAGAKAAMLTRQLLAFSRKQISQPRLLDLNTLLADLSKVLLRLVKEDVELVTVLAAKNAWVFADPGQLDEVLMNLVMNAGDAMPSGGKLTIETSEVTLEEDYASRHVGVVPGPYVMVSVTDTGCGIEKEVLPHIFEPFFTTKPKHEGTGLGLSTAYGIVKQSGGNIWVYSEIGHGTTFKIYLPHVEGKGQADSKSLPEIRETKGNETILLVEDEPVVRTLIGQILRRQGYQVLEAVNGRVGLTVSAQHQGTIDLVLTDVVMPEMNGRELVRELLTGHPGMKVLYMSGYTDDTIVRHGILNPGTPFIQKPFSPEALCHKVREVLTQR